VFELHLVEVDLQLFGDQQSDGSIGALAHLDIGQWSGTICPSPSMRMKSVGREAIERRAAFGFAVCERQAQAQHQASAGGRSGPAKKLRRERTVR